ncbi:hypothetical protein V1511DRAFT_460220 [Dipodascopsis uninucleata]
MDSRPQPTVRRSASAGPSTNHDDDERDRNSASSERGVRRSKQSNIYSSLTGSSRESCSIAMSVSPIRKRPLSVSLTRTRPISTYSSDQSRNSIRKSSVSRNSDGSGSGSVSIRFSIAPRARDTIRSFSGAVDILPGEPGTEDANSDIVDYDEMEQGVNDFERLADIPASSSLTDIPVSDETGFETDLEAAGEHLTRRAYTGIPGFYYNNAFGSNYNSSEEELDDSSVSDVFVDTRESVAADAESIREPMEIFVARPPLDHERISDDYRINIDPINEQINNDNNLDKAEPIVGNNSENDEVNETSEDRLEAYKYQYPNLQQNRQDPQYDPNSRWSQIQVEVEQPERAIHPPIQSSNRAASTFDFVYRVRNIAAQEDQSSYDVHEQVKQPKQVLVPVYSEGLSFSTFPYINSLAPLSTIVRQQPRGQYATTIVGDRTSMGSAILPPIPTRSPPRPSYDPARFIPARYLGSQTADEDFDAEMQESSDMARIQPIESPQTRSLAFEDPLDMLVQLQRQQIDQPNLSLDISRRTSFYPPLPMNYEKATIKAQKNLCPVDIARIMLVAFMCFPPLWLFMGFGGMDKALGKVPRTERFIAKVLGISFFTISFVGMIVGLAVAT